MNPKKLKILIVYASRQTGNSKKIALGLNQLFTDSEVYSVENAPPQHNYDFIILGTGIYRGWPDPPMKNYMKNCSNKNIGIFITLGAWPDSEHAKISIARIEGLLSDSNVVASFACQGRIDPELVKRMKEKPAGTPHSWNEERAKRILAAESHPNDDDIRKAFEIFSKAIEKIRNAENQDSQKLISPEDIRWNMSPNEIEKQSFSIIENEFPQYKIYNPEQWKIIRRIIHTTTDFSIAQNISFRNNPIQAGIEGLKNANPIFCDSNMIKSGISLKKLQSINPSYSGDYIHCYIANNDVAEYAKNQHITRALASVIKAKKILHNSIILIGNAPLALAKIAEYCLTGEIKPQLIIAMPVGFVNVIESKALLARTNIPHIMLHGRRGGSTIAVATLHAIIECI